MRVLLESAVVPKSLELCRTAMFSAILTAVLFITFSYTWPVLPPIVVIPFVTSFVLALSIPFSRNQWVTGLVASLFTIILKGGILPGPFIIPFYGFIFTSRRVKLSGLLTSIIHLFYGILLAPLIFSVAPAKIVYEWVLLYANNFAPVIVSAMLIFGALGAIASSVGYTIGLRIARSCTNGGLDDS
jgi:hypothetical protein